LSKESTRERADINILPTKIRPIRLEFSSPSFPFDRFTSKIFLLSIMSRKLKDDFSWAIIGRIKSFAKKTSNLFVIYGTMFASSASPPAWVAIFSQNCFTIIFLQCFSFRFLKASSDKTLEISIIVQPDSG
jgi:hypothetical protein